MFLRVSRQRRADGTLIRHLQIAESVWNPEKKRSETRIILNCGRAEDERTVERLRRLVRSIQKRLDPEALVLNQPGWRVMDAWPFGHVHALEQMWQRIGLAEVLDGCLRGRQFEFSVERALFAMVANRACAPSSKLYCWEQWLREDVRIEGTRELELQHLYRAMDVLEANQEAIERQLYNRVADLFNLDVELVFYDTTSLHFEVDEEDEEDEDEDDTVGGSKSPGGKACKALGKRGYSKNGRGDAPQVVVGMAVTRDGIPVRHWVFPGNTVDVTTVAQVKDELRGWRLTRCVFVGDAGMVSRENLAKLAESGGRYIVCMPMSEGSEVATKVMSRSGRYKEVKGNLRVKQVWVGDGERRRRYIVCHNPEEDRRQRRHRAKVLAELEAELTSLAQGEDGQLSKRACELRASGRYGRYLRQTRGGKLVISKRSVREAERRDGKFVVHSNDDTLTAEDLALGYKQLQRVEQAWRSMKTVLRLRPVYHYVPHRIRAHISLTVLALLLERLIEKACADSWRNIRDDLRQVKLVQLSGPNGTFYQVTEPGPDARKRLNSLRIRNLPVVVEVD